jgi:hypothetical protein
MLSLLFCHPAMGGQVERAARNSGYILLEKDKFVYLLREEDMSEVYELDFFTDYPEATDVEVLSAWRDGFLVRIYGFSHLDRKYDLIAYYNPLQDQLSFKTNLEKRLKFCFERNDHLVFGNSSVFYVLNTDTMSVERVPSGISSMSSSLQNEDGIFWAFNHLNSDGLLHQYQLGSVGLVKTGYTQSFLIGDLESFFKYYLIDSMGEESLYVGGLVFDLLSGEYLASYPEHCDILAFADDSFLFADYSQAGTQIGIRRHGGKGDDVHYLPHSLNAIAEDAEFYYLVRSNTNYSYKHDPDSWELLKISKIIAPDGRGQRLRPVFPENWYSVFYGGNGDETCFFECGDGRIGYQQRGAAFGSSNVVVVDVKDKEILFSFETREYLEPNPDYCAERDSVIYSNGRELFLGDGRAGEFHSLFDTQGSTFFHSGSSRLFCGSFSPLCFDLSDGKVYPSFHSISYGETISEGPEGSIFQKDAGNILKYDSAEALKLGDYTDLGPSWFKSSYYLSVGFESLTHNWNRSFFMGTEKLYTGDNLDQVIPLGAIEEGTSSPAKSGIVGQNFCYALKSIRETPSSDPEEYLLVWRLDGTPVRKIRLSSLLGGTVKWTLFRSGETLVLLGARLWNEMYLIELDDNSGDVEPFSAESDVKLTFGGWYDSSLFGPTHDSHPNWQYTLASGWRYAHDSKDHTIIWDPYFGFIRQDKVHGHSNIFYVYDSGWKCALGERNGWIWFFDYQYQFEESNYPALPPLTIKDRNILFDFQSAKDEIWRFTEDSIAEFREIDEPRTQTQLIQYEGPTHPGDSIVTVYFDDVSIGLSGYYRLTFSTKTTGTVEAHVTFINPQNPSDRYDFTESGTFKVLSMAELK